MDIESISIDKNIANQGAVSGEDKKIGNSNFKKLFVDITAQLQKVAHDYADTSKNQIEIKGEKFDKNAPGTAIVVSQYLTDLQNLNQLSLDLLTKRGTFEDQVSKMIS